MRLSLWTRLCVSQWGRILLCRKRLSWFVKSLKFVQAGKFEVENRFAYGIVVIAYFSYGFDFDAAKNRANRTLL
ncbi:hypothetical protein BC2926_38510 [Bacillus cereus]|nr:hypothetical protein BC2926_38510 [Bacillus cereus]